MGYRHLPLMLIGILLSAGTVSGNVDIRFVGSGDSFSQGAEYLDSNLSLTFNEFIPKDSWLYIFLDKESIPRGEISLERYLHDEDYYEYGNITFSYNISADGTLRWSEYHEQEFWYRITVSGLCGTTGEGGCYTEDPPVDACDCSVCLSPGPPYPCAWSLTFPSTGVKQGTVNGNPAETGLKFIYDLGGGGLPVDAVPGSVTWDISKEGASPPEVDLSMRAVCGSESYNGKIAWPDGWIIQTISTPSNPCTEYVSGGFDCRVMIGPFDDVSMTSSYRRFGGPTAYPSGGVFRTNDFMTNRYQNRHTEVDWNGTSGEIILKDIDSDSTYVAVYLPPNGPKVCAYTSKSTPMSSTWSSEHLVSGASAGYLKPYTRLYTQADLDSFPSLAAPDCPIPASQQFLCNRDDVTYTAISSEGDVAVSDSFDGENLTVTGTVNQKMLTGYEEAKISLSEFDIGISDLTESTGNHTIRAVIDNGTGTFEKTLHIYVCQDNDGDGYCAESGDCNDTNILQNPGIVEKCNGVDDDCDGIVDDGIAGMGENMGKPCNDWTGSVCVGVYVCNPNGTEIVCKPDSGIYPGDRQEYCDNMLDDDCDRAIDEDQGFVIDGIVQPKCLEGGDLCIEGQERSCGQCGDGTSTCTNGVWGNCTGGSAPKPETCNSMDDDCDGEIDNILGKESAVETKCRCYGGGSPASESCNNIDDDCDGQIDEGVSGCCTTGDNKLCETDVGACEPGIKECVDGVWGECRGAVMPVQEICCNGIDEDCDGQADDGCTGCGKTHDFNEDMMLYLSIMGIGIILISALLIYKLVMKK